MIIDCRTWGDLPDNGKSERRRVFVDGREITGVWYVDTDAGLVKTFHLGQTGDQDAAEFFNLRAKQWEQARIRGKAYSGHGFNRKSVPAEWEIEAPIDGVISRTIHGKVELKEL